MSGRSQPFRGTLAFLFLLAYLASAPLVLFTLGSVEIFRAELGASDDVFLRGNDSSWSRAYRDSGPFRVRRGERRMTYFAARMAFPGAAVRLPVWVEDGDGELQMRAHRYGQPGVVHVFGNGIQLGTMVFETDTYPWEVFRFRVPRNAFGSRARELLVELRGEATVADVDLPPEALVAFDWMELGADPDGGGSLRLSPHLPWLAFFLPGAVLLTLWWGGAALWIRLSVTAVAIAATWLALATAPGPASGALTLLPVVFPFGLLVYASLIAFRVDGILARGLSAAVALVLLAHATIIFFPDHQPPDLGPHLGQIRRLNDGRFAWSQFWEFSSSFGEDGRGKPHFGADYEAPYPPWTYLLVHALRGLLNVPRFWLEMIGMVAGVSMALLAYFLARRLAEDASAPAFAFALMSLEISTWHHAARVHTPGLVGQVFFLAAVAYLAHRHDELARPRVFVAFAAWSLAATLAYTATLFHFVAFMVCFTAVSLLRDRAWRPSANAMRAVGAGVAGTLGAIALFYRRFVLPAIESRDAVLAAEGYRAPATYLFLRNQMRDTVRILDAGYPLFGLLALPALVRLRRFSRDEIARRVIVAWSSTYVLLLVLKDPMLFPQLFLHVKEDLLFAPLACILGGMTLASLWRRGALGRLGVLAILFVFFALQVQDYLFNADTISVWAETQRE